MPNERRTANGLFLLEKEFFSFENSYYEFAHGMDYKDSMVFNNYPPHIHDHYEIYVKMNGDISFMVDNVMYSIEDYDAVISHPGDVHNAIVHKNCTHDHYCLWFSSSALAEFFTEKSIRGVVRLNEEKKKQLKRLLTRLEKEENKLLITLNILRIIALLAEGEEEVEALAMPEKLQDILKYIDENLGSHLNTENLCNVFYISRTKLHQISTAAYGVSITKYILDKRMKKARELLRMGKSVESVAEEVGFSTANYFSKVFHRECGILPSKF